MKKTPLYEEHMKLNGKIVDFAGWDLPVMYSSIIKEHNATRAAAGLFDISHMGEILIKGNKAKNLLEKLIPTSLKKLEIGKAMYSCFCNENGGVIDDLFIFMNNDKEYYLVVNAATIEKDYQWLQKHNTDNLEIINCSENTAKIDLQGPQAKKIAKKLFSAEIIDNLERFYFKNIDFSGTNLMISCTGYTAEHGYELFLENKQAVILWQKLLEAGKEYNLEPVGLGARDSLRLEACYSLYGHEINDSITPIEGGIGWIVSSECDYIGKEILEKQKKDGARRKVVAFELIDKGVPRENYRIEKDGIDIGYCTSGGFSPTFKKGIGLAIINSEKAKIGDKFELLVRNRKLTAQIVKKPFYKFAEGS